MFRGTFLLWGMFNAVIAILSFFFLQETKGLSLEEINRFYGKDKGLVEEYHPSPSKVDSSREGSMSKSAHDDV